MTLGIDTSRQNLWAGQEDSGKDFAHNSEHRDTDSVAVSVTAVTLVFVESYYLAVVNVFWHRTLPPTQTQQAVQVLQQILPTLHDLWGDPGLASGLAGRQACSLK